MRLLALLRTAWEAEGLHLRRLARARGIQAGLAAAAVVFGLMLLLMLHLALFAGLASGLGPVWAALVVALFDLVLFVAFALAAGRTIHDPIAIEARRVRQDAVRQLGDGAARAAMIAPLLKSQSAKKGLFGAAITALVVGILSRR